MRAAAEFLAEVVRDAADVSALGAGDFERAKRRFVTGEPEIVNVDEARFTDYTEPLGQFRVTCTKGTYIRSIAHELGQKLGCGAHLTTLRRSASGKFDVADALPLDTILKLTTAELEKRVMPFLKLAA